MAIDDKFDAIEKAYPAKKSYLPDEMAALAARWVLPAAITDALDVVLQRLGPAAQQQRAEEILKLLIAGLKDLESKSVTKQDLDNLKEAIQLAVRHDVAEFNDRKRDRYVKIIGNALRDEKQVDDLASYVQDVERLGERDFAALRVLNKVMNKTGDWYANRGSVVHPGLFIQRRQELAVQMAQALGVNADKEPFSREEGYDVCNRLQAFGLAHEIEVSPRQVPVGDYCFRPSLRGLTLLKLVGEEVPNWSRYNPQE